MNILGVTFALFSIMYHLRNTGSSQNVIVLAKGKPLTVWATPSVLISFVARFENMQLSNKMFYKKYCRRDCCIAIWFLRIGVNFGKTREKSVDF